MWCSGHVTSPHAAPNAVSDYQLLQTAPFPGTPSLEWRIELEKGQLRLLSPDSMNLGTGLAYSGALPTIEAHDYETGEVEKVQWDWSAVEKEVSVRARSVGRSLYAFADGVDEKEGWVGLEDAVKRAKQIEGWLVDAGF